MKHKISLSCLFVGILAFGLLGAANAGTKRQSITFGPAPSVTVGGTGTVSATASSGLSVTLTSTTPAICTLSGNTVTGVKVGTCRIAANQAGNSTYAAARQVKQSFNVAQRKQQQSITLGPAPSVTVGGTGTVSATASSGLPVTLASSTPAVCTLNGNTVTGVSVGTCKITANQSGNATYAAAPQVQLLFNVTQASAGGTATCADGQTWPVSNDPVIDGRRAYLRLNCEGCHGQTGLGSMGPNIQDEDEIPLNGDGAMPSFTKFLCPNDARNLMAYLKVIKSSSAPRFLDWDKPTPSANSGPFSDAALP